MSFETIELSQDDGRPVELFHFSYSTDNWFFTSGDTPIVYLVNEYTPVPISRGDLEPSNDATKASLSITVTRDSPIGELFRVQPPSETVVVTVLAEHFIDNDYTTIWKGRIIGAEWKNDGTLELTSESVFSSLLRPGLRRRFQFGCPFALYGTDCGISRDVWREDQTVTTLDGLRIHGSDTFEKPEQWYAGGYATWVNNVTNNIERRMIRSSEGSGWLSLAALPVGLAVGQNISLFPGCDHTLEGPNGCAVKFVNFVRYGGTPFLPTKNPFNGSTIY